MSKAKDIITHKASIGGTAITVLSLLGYGGYQQFVPEIKDKIAIKLDQVENRQEEQLELTKELIFSIKTKTILDHPGKNVDSVYKEIVKEDFWNRR